jgi:SAM-dependent methyltransferase
MSFGSIAEDYDRLRPPPAGEAIDWLLPEHCRVAVDLAAGTGLLTRALARKVAHVVAVEPDPRMASVLRARSPGVHVVQGRGEAIPLRDGCADGVFISSAWHWMDPGRAAAEVRRVLRDGGRFGMIWTSLDRDEGWLDGTDWMNRVRGARAASEISDTGDSDGPSAAEPDAGDSPRPQGGREITLPDGMFTRAGTATFRYRRPMTISDIVAMLATYSSVITADPRERESRLAEARTALEERFPGAETVEVPMRSRCWRADRA